MGLDSRNKNEDNIGMRKDNIHLSLDQQPRLEIVTPTKETGLDPPPDRALQFIFHVLIPIEAWSWNEACHMFMRFNHPKLGKWQQDVGKFKKISNLHIDLCEMEGTVVIDSNLLKDQASLLYKYLVYSPTTVGNNSPYEFLHNAPASVWGQKDVSRRIFIPKSRFQSNGSLHHYDNMVYAESKSRNVFTRAFDSMVSLTSKGGPVVPDHSSMQEKALRAYLTKYYNILTKCDLSPTFNVIQVTKQITNIFLDLYCQFISSTNTPWVAHKLDEVMCEWFAEVTNHLQFVSVTSAQSNGRRMASALTIIFCVYKLTQDHPKMSKMSLECTQMLLSFLYLWPDLEHCTCSDLEFVYTLIPKINRTDVSKAVADFCLKLSHHMFLKSPQWLYAIPLLHFLSGTTKPFQKLSCDPKEIKWSDPSLKLDYVRKYRDDKQRMVKMRFDKFKFLMALDPLFVPTLVYVCPETELQYLFHQIPTYISIAWLAKLYKDSQDLSTSEVTKNIPIHDFTEIVKDLIQQLQDEAKTDYQELNSALCGSCWLFEELICKQTSSRDDYYLECLKAVITLVLTAASRLASSSDDLKELEKIWAVIVKTVSSLHPKLEMWIKWKLSKQSFGRSLLKLFERDSQQELKVWNALFQVNCTSKKVLDLWHINILLPMIKGRVSHVGIDIRIQLFDVHLESQYVHDLISNVFLECIQDSIKNIGSSKRQEKKKTVGKIIDTLLARQYSSHIPISLELLLKWDLWPIIIVIFKSEAMIKIEDRNRASSFMPDRCEMMCTSAVSTLEGVCQDIFSGDITLKDTDMILQRKVHMQKLCSAVKSGDLDKQGKEYELVKKSIEERIVELKTFKAQKDYLVRLCHGITVTISGIRELQNDLQHNFDTAKLNSLCVSDGSRIMLQQFKSAAPLDPIKIKYDFISQHHHNDLFHRIWDHTSIRALRENAELTISDIVTKIWNPTVKECCRILDSLQASSMKLHEVDDLFGNYKGPCVIQNNLYTLLKGMELCCDREPPHECPIWITNAVEHMQKYWILCDRVKSARIVLDFQKRLGLTGNFCKMELIASLMSSTTKCKTLEAIDASLVEAEEFLRILECDQTKMKCVEAFANSLDLIQWIRSEAKCVDDVHIFVYALRSTTSESDYSCDRLSNLMKIAKCYNSLLFDLKENNGFETFRQGCLNVWNFIDAAPDLPEKLCACRSDLEWYKAVNEVYIHSSIELATFGQINNIFAYGCYVIGSQRPQVFRSIHDIIHLILTERDKPLTIDQYSLNEVRDIKNKLALIVGKNDESKTKVDVFTDTVHNVCQIAELLISLQQAGNVKYIGWTLHVPCGLDHAASLLQDQAKKMTQELKNWEEEVALKRRDFYELNYFTTPQLLSLQRNLGVFKSKPRSGPHDVTPNVLALLESISTEVTAPRVFATVQSVIVETITSTASSLSTPTIPTQSGALNVTPSPSSLADLERSSMSPTVTKVPSLSEELLISANVHTSCGAKKFEVDDKISDTSYDETCSYQLPPWQRELLIKKRKSSSKPPWIPEMEKLKRPPLPLKWKMIQKRESSSSKSIVSPDAESVTIHSGVHQVETQPQLPIDRNHPVVQQLCSAGYSEEQSLEAVERFETLEGAMDYLVTQGGDDKGGVFQTGAPARQDSKYCVSEPTIHCDPNAEKDYLSLNELGYVLTHLTQVLQARVAIPRTFNTKILKCGHPNLIVTSPNIVVKTVLALYMEDEVLPLPTLEEVLVCNSTTTAEEVTLLWQRAIDDPEFKRIFCLVHAERLTYQVSDKALRSLSELSQGRRNYHLVIICSNVEEETSHIISKLHSCRRPFALTIDTEQCKRYLKTHFTGQVESVSSSQIQTAMASNVDCENSYVRLVTSQRSGMGKSLFIQRMVEHLQMNKKITRNPCVTIPLHGPKVTPDIVLDYIEKYMQEPPCTIYHLDIAPTILSEVDTILFNLLILSGLIDSQGRVWRCHAGQLYAVELTLPENQKQISQVGQTLALAQLLPSVHCVSPRESLERMIEDRGPDPLVIAMDDKIFAQPTCQRVYQYLRHHMYNLKFDEFSYSGNVEGTKRNCLEVLLQYISHSNFIRSNCGNRDPSWSEIRNFTEFLDIQLRCCDRSEFFSKALLKDKAMSGFKEFVVKFMIHMSRDFATSSFTQEERKSLTDIEIDDIEVEQYQIAGRRHWGTNFYPYIFFNDDRNCITFVGLMVTRNGDLMDPTDGGVIQHHIMSPQLCTELINNSVDIYEDYRQWSKSTMLEKIAAVMGLNHAHDPDETYVLTVDNLIKILAIQMRFRCGIPVVIMGETGCGKTRLIRYMCDLARQGKDRLRNLFIMKVHGGTTEKDIELFIKRAETEAEQNREKNINTVVFFDEANTTDAIGLIKEIMCDRRIHGKSVSGDLKFIAACNPYRKHTEDMIKKLENAGLGFYVRESDTQQKLGKIPLRQLVYRVLDLPPSMRPLVYDFGQLQQRTEDDYIRQIVQDHVTNHAGLSQESPHYISAIAKVLAWSQDYMRGRKDECSFVSLRDVERAMIVFKYFYEKMDIFAPLIDKKQQEDEDHDEDEIYDEEIEPEQMLRVPVAARPRPQAIGKIARALILSLSICYHARLQHRRAYEEGVSQQFVNPLFLPGGDERFRDEIRWCQEVLLDNMRLGENIAKNAALRENVFMMAICIELRIPLFLVGKPGSSKSLAKAVIYASMRGKSSNTELLKGFKEVAMFSYQCSQLSTPESVIEVFSTASRFQSKQDTKSYVAVVVLDEVGLVEDSPNLPLKALHPLLEDGTEGASNEERSDMIIAREERVAFIGISNWALDPAKMNRGVMVTRGDPSEDELEFSAEGICSNKVDDPVKARLKLYFKPLSEAYMKICYKQYREFFGLRDFYSLIKMLYWMCEKSGCPLTWPQLEHAIKRNFGGLESKDLDPVKIFMDKLPCSRQPPDLSGIPKDLHSVVSPDCTQLGLIRTCLNSNELNWHSENRYLLLLTENLHIALGIFKLYLSLGVDSSQTLGTANMKQETVEPLVLFGSNSPKDKKYTQVCRILKQIMVCMETGRTVILLNLEILYENLYGVLNHYNGGNRYVDLGLQTYSVSCRVHDDFKLILIAEKDKVYEEYPITLTSRLEKHFVLVSLILEELHSRLSLLPHIALRPSLMEKNTQTPLSTTRNQATQMEKSILVTRKTQTVQTTVFTQATQTEESICDIKSKSETEPLESVKEDINSRLTQVLDTGSIYCTQVTQTVDSTFDNTKSEKESTESIKCRTLVQPKDTRSNQSPQPAEEGIPLNFVRTPKSYWKVHTIGAAAIVGILSILLALFLVLPSKIYTRDNMEYQHPHLYLLQNLDGLKILQEIGASYSYFGTMILKERSGNRLSAIEMECKYRVECINYEVAKAWLSGDSEFRENTWTALIDVLCKIQMKSLAERIIETLKKRNIDLGDSDTGC